MIVLVGLVMAEGGCLEDPLGLGDVRLPKSTQLSISDGSTYCLLGGWKLMAWKCDAAIKVVKDSRCLSQAWKIFGGLLDWEEAG